jgi:Cdc6-like AAA superfamily ATPase
VSVGQLSAGLREIFPTGVPPRLLVLGTGGTGKTVLTKQAWLEQRV